MPVATGNWIEDAERSVVGVFGPIDDELSNNVVASMLFQIGRGGRELDLVISSPGGSVVSAIAIMDAMRDLAETYSYVIRTWAVGSNAGMAVWIVAAGSRGERRMAADGNLCMLPLTSSDVGPVADREIESLHGQVTSELATRIHATTMDVNFWMDARRIFSVDEAIEAGLIDAVTT